MIDPDSGRQVPAVLLSPQPVFADDVEAVVRTGSTTADRVCTTAQLQAACARHRVT